jgi:hypothetical protein
MLNDVDLSCPLSRLNAAEGSPLIFISLYNHAISSSAKIWTIDPSDNPKSAASNRTETPGSTQLFRVLFFQVGKSLPILSRILASWLDVGNQQQPLSGRSDGIPHRFILGGTYISLIRYFTDTCDSRQSSSDAILPRYTNITANSAQTHGAYTSSSDGFTRFQCCRF